MADIKLNLIVNDRGEVVIKNMGKALGAVGTQATKASKSLFGMSEITRGMAIQVGMMIQTQLMMLPAAAYRAFSGFDSAMKQSLAIMGDVSEQMKGKMDAVAKETAVRLGLATEEAARSYFYLASAGLSAAEAVAAMPAVAEFAKAGMFDMALATDLLTDAQSALGMVIKGDVQGNFERMTALSDVLVKANTLANASVQQFSEALTTKAGAALKMFNKDAAEGVAVLAALADQGVKGQVAGSSLSIVIRNLTTAAAQNSAEFDRLGVHVFDASGKMGNMADIIGDLEDAMAGLSDEQKKNVLLQLGFADKAQATLLTLIGTSQKIRDYEAKLRQAGGTTADVAAKQMEAVSEKTAQFVEMLKVAAISVFQALAPAIVMVIDFMTKVMKQTWMFVQAVSLLVAPLIKVAAKVFGLSAAMELLGGSTFTVQNIFDGLAATLGTFVFGLVKVAEAVNETAFAFHALRGNVEEMKYYAEQKTRIEELKRTVMDMVAESVYGAEREGKARTDVNKILEETRKRLEELAGGAGGDGGATKKVVQTIGELRKEYELLNTANYQALSAEAALKEHQESANNILIQQERERQKVTYLNVGVGAMMLANMREQIMTTIGAAREEANRAGAIKKIADEMLKAKQITQEEYDKITGVTKATFSWGGALDQVANVMRVLGISSDSTFAKIVGGFSVAAAAAEQYNRAVGEGAKAQKGMAVAQAAAAAYQSKSILKGAATGAAFGAMVGGPLGAGIGAVVGGMLGWLGKHRDPIAKAAKEIGKEFGEKVSREFAEEMKKQADKMGIALRDAVLLNLTKFADETGKSMVALSDETDELMRKVADGAVPMSEGIDSIGEAFAKLGEEAEAGVEGASGALVRMVQQARALGLSIPEITAAVAAGVSQMSESFIAMFGEEGGGALLYSAEQTGSLFQAAFWAKVREEGLISAIDTFAEIWQKLADAFEGFVSLESLGRIPEMMALATEETRPLLEAIRQSQQFLNGMAASGYLTADAFTAIQAAAVEAYQKLIAAGASEEAALLAIRPLLMDLERTARDYGQALDPATQELINQAKAMGAFPVDPLYQIVDLLAEMVRVMGGDLPDSIRRSRDAMDEFAASARNVPTPSGPGGPDRGGYPQHAMGGVITRPTVGLIGEAGAEVVAPVSALFGRLGDMIASRVTKSGDGGGVRDVYVQMPTGEFIKAIETLQLSGDLRIHPGAVKEYS